VEFVVADTKNPGCAKARLAHYLVETSGQGIPVYLKLPDPFPPQQYQIGPQYRQARAYDLCQFGLDAHGILAVEISHLRIILPFDGLQTHLLRLRSLGISSLTLSVLETGGRFRPEVAIVCVKSLKIARHATFHPGKEWDKPRSNNPWQHAARKLSESLPR
jgi:hypothetical protein